MTFDIIIFTDMSGQFYHNKPAGAYSLASTLRQNNYSVLVIDHFQRYLREPKKLFELVQKFIGPNTLFVGFSSTFYTIDLPDDKPMTSWKDFDQGTPVDLFPESNIAELLIKYIRKINPNTKFVYGGIAASRETVLESNVGIDYVIQGYAETSALCLADHLKNGSPLKTKTVGSIQLLDYDYTGEDFIFKNHSIKYQDHDVLLPGETLVFESSRGCMYNCTFCNFPLRNRKRNNFDYHMDDELLREYFLRNYRLAGITNYMLSDSTFNETTEKLIRFRDVVKSTGLDLKFTCWARIDLLRKYPEQLDLMLEAGIISIWIGLESLHQASSSSITKTYSVEEIKQTVLDVRARAGKDFKIYGSFIFGLPHDTPETIANWMEWVINESTIDCIQIEPLNIGVDRTPWPADFSKNLESYGYDHVPSELDTKYRFMSTIVWNNKIWTFTEAAELAKKYQQLLWDSGRNRLAAFGIFGMLSYGYTFNEIKDLSLKDLPYDDIIKRGQEQFKDYHNRLSAIANNSN